MPVLTLAIMKEMWPNGNQHVAGLLEGTIEASSTVFAKYGLDSNLIIAHAMAQFSEECGAGLEMSENLNYTAQRLREVFPTHFSISLANKAAHNPKMIGEIAYGGRMGNSPLPSTDGYDYRGRGFSQCTGKTEYEALGKELDIDLLADPDWLSEPEHALEGGVADFVWCGCLSYAKKDDILGVTKKLNGGINGLSIRRQWLVKWKRILKV